jgi:hypothetical protein
LLITPSSNINLVCDEGLAPSRVLSQRLLRTPRLLFQPIAGIKYGGQ